MTAAIVVGTWQAVGQTGIMFRDIMFRHQRGKLRGHAMHRRPEKKAVGKVAQVEGGTERASTANAGAEGTMLHHQPMHGCTGSAPCVNSRHRVRTHLWR
jgi:hypothetical protein